MGSNGFWRPDIQIVEHDEEEYLKWGIVWEAPPQSFIQYVTVSTADDNYILVDVEHICTACTFRSEPHGPVFTKEEIVKRLKGFRRIGAYVELFKEDKESAFDLGMRFEREKSQT